uniref:Putative secreted protein n=1 Tax=Ixodes ricinus TaxID=34613 RepID=A0A6B0USU2_IXORI
MVERRTTILAASSKLSQARILSLLVAIRAFASSTCVPWSLTTMGILRSSVSAARMTPSAMTSHRMMPPKMFTRMACTFWSDVISLKASVTWWAVAPPPTSRKLAGLPPCSLMMSMVAMARPAPLTRQPMSPSRAM